MHIYEYIHMCMYTIYAYYICVYIYVYIYICTYTQSSSNTLIPNYDAGCPDQLLFHHFHKLGKHPRTVQGKHPLREQFRQNTQDFPGQQSILSRNPGIWKSFKNIRPQCLPYKLQLTVLSNLFEQWVCTLNCSNNGRFV